MYLFDKFELR